MDERIGAIERRMTQLENAHKALKTSIDANTTLTQAIETNTKDMVELFRAAKTTNNVFMWLVTWFLKIGGIGSMLLVIWHAVKTGDISHLWKIGE